MDRSADVYVDGVKEATVDDSGSQSQAVIFSKSGLSDGPHTLKIVVDGTHTSGSTDNFVSIDAIDVPTGTVAAPSYPLVPQQPDTAITLDGRDSHLIVTNYQLGGNQLQYSTSEIMTNATIAGRDVAVLYGDHGSDGETVLNYEKQPTVTSTGGAVTSIWDSAAGDLRLNYTHSGLIRVQVNGGKHPLLLLVADSDTAKTFWRQDTAAVPVIVRGTHLLRGATSDGTNLALTGDTDTDNSIEGFSGASRITWNGKKVQTQLSATGSRVGDHPAGAVQLEARAGVAGVAAGLRRLELGGCRQDDVQQHDVAGNAAGAVRRRLRLSHRKYLVPRRFTSTGKETGITLSAQSGGGAAASSVWLNGTFLGSSTKDGQATYTFPAGSLKANGDNVISVLTVNMGHEEDYNASNGNKAARGLTGASLVGNARHGQLAAAGCARRGEPDRRRARSAGHRRAVWGAGRLHAARLPDQ